MLQNQMPAWVSHSLPDPCQAEDGRYLASCALKVRENTVVGGGGSARGRWPGRHAKEMKSLGTKGSSQVPGRLAGGHWVPRKVGLGSST